MAAYSSLLGLLLVVAVVVVALASGKKEDNKFVINGVKVEILKKPKTCDFAAEDDDKLAIHYRGTLEDGKEFDSSYKRKRPFEFTLGQGQVIKGWEAGIKGMCINEKRRLTVPADMGYGEAGSPPVIPPGATLIFETELLDID